MPDQYHRFTVILDQESDGGYSVYCPALPGCSSQGDNRAEALEMIKDAIVGVLGSVEERRPDQLTVPLAETPQLIADELREALEFRIGDGDPVTMEIVAVEVATWVPV